MNSGEKETTITNYLRTNAWIRRELCKAANLPARKMVARVRELLGRAEALGREVNEFMEKKDHQ